MKKDFTERITGRTKLMALLGSPISHSLSPKMHNLSFEKLGLDYIYLAFDVNSDEQLADVIKGFRALNIRGANITMPNKTLVCKYLDKLSPAAEMTGSVNTIVNDGGVLKGYMTDGVGYMRSLKEEGVDIIGKKIVVAGAGGAATAICVQAALDGVKEISIFNRKTSSYTRAEKVAQKINKETNCKAKVFDLYNINILRTEIQESSIFIDATSVGMKPLEDKCNIPDPSILYPDLVVSDIVYEPSKTKLLNMAEKQGCKVINGYGMVLWQGAEAFKLWTGKEMPVDYVKELLFKK